MTGLWMDDWGLELTESIAITDGAPEVLANVPRNHVVKS
jgi:ectoine hydrolase